MGSHVNCSISYSRPTFTKINLIALPDSHVIGASAVGFIEPVLQPLSLFVQSVRSQFRVFGFWFPNANLPKPVSLYRPQYECTEPGVRVLIQSMSSSSYALA